MGARTTIAHEPALDGLRAIAVLLVVAFHARAPGAGQWPTSGYVGVDVFFVLSGYLITSLLRAELDAGGRIDLLGFYRRRFIRLAPPLLAMLAAYLAIASTAWPDTPSHGSDALRAGAYISNFGAPLAFLGHTWSLSVEWQFYLLWPVVLPLIIRLRRPGLILWLLYVAATFLRGAVDWDTGYRQLHVSGLILGAAITYAPRPALMKPAAWLGLVFIALAASGFRWDTMSGLTVGVSLAELGTAMVILGQSGSAGQVLSNRALGWLGVLSYGIYLWHYPMARYLRDDLSQWPVFAITLGASLLLASASHLTVERWTRPLRRSPDRGPRGQTQLE